MNMFVPMALFGWIPVVLLLFANLPPRRAVIVAFLLAWLFLPMAGYSLSGLPDYTKMTATSYGVMLGVMFFDVGRLTRFRLRWVDLPMVVWCVVPFASSVTNGLGAYDGVSGVVGTTIVWGFPYFIGRLYFSDLDGLRELAIGIFIGGLVYVPLCVWEIRMSPQLHRMLYGFQHRGWGVERFGGYRPVVFMDTGLALGIWMTVVTLIGVWLWRTKAFLSVLQVPMAILAPVVFVTTILCKSAGALALLLVGLGVLFLTRWTRSRIFLICLLLGPIGYIAVRSTGDWSGQAAIEMATLISEERADSLQGRFINEDLLAEKAWQRPVFGWGGWGRNRVYDDFGNDITVTDGLWIIAFGHKGLVGLVALYGVFLLPSILLVWRIPAVQWSRPAFAPAGVLAVSVVLFAIDQLLNAMANPIFILCAGGLAGFALTIGRGQRRIVPADGALSIPDQSKNIGELIS